MKSDPRPDDRSTRGASLLEYLVAEVSALHAKMLDPENRPRRQLRSLHPTYVRSAENLLQYLSLRRTDLRTIQDGLTTLGLSSLGRAESHVHDNLDSIIAALHGLARRPVPDDLRHDPRLSAAEGRALLKDHTDRLLGPEPRGRTVRVMVTMPTEAGRDPALVRSLLEAGMDVCRINCAHDDPTTWGRIIENLRAAERAGERPCRVCMDVAGPKVRTGPIEDGPQVVAWHPRHDATGTILAPSRLWLTRADSPTPAPSAVSATVPIPGEVLDELSPGDRLELDDARGKARSLVVESRPATGQGAFATCERTAYLVPGISVRVKPSRSHSVTKFRLGPLPPVEQAIRVLRGETVILAARAARGSVEVRDEEGCLTEPARISLTLPEVLVAMRPGQTVWFDDGRIGGVVETANAQEIHVRITACRPQGDKIRADRGVNLPDTDLPVPALTERDVADLAFIARHADIVGLSFVREAQDVHDLRAHLARLGRPDLGVVLKIETRRAFEELPRLLLASMESARSGVMIARGDLAVECGYQRLAEVQEEILWMCEAAHMPVIWATQVLDGLAKRGLPSRSEITDAAMGERAECVMLGKGPHIVDAVRVLDDILRRMEPHQYKKRSMLRALNVARVFYEERTAA
jgi:pyruvate kinase